MTVVITTTTQASVTITESGGAVVVPVAEITGVEVNQAGVPPGGNPNDVLVKSSGTDYHSEWTSQPEVDALHFDLTVGIDPGTGQLAWNADEGTLELGKANGISNYIGAETIVLCRNNSNSVAIPKGTAVMFAGTLGASGRLKVAPMISDGSLPGYVFFGVTDQAIAGAADGYVTTFGKIKGINTNAYVDGDILWCNPAVAGGFTKVEPQAPNLKLAVAAVVRATNNGTIFVRATAGSRLQDLHDVEANGSKDSGDVLEWVAAASRWQPTDRLSLLEARVTTLENQDVILLESS
jgi:hypothetical protein